MWVTSVPSCVLPNTRVCSQASGAGGSSSSIITVPVQATVPTTFVSGSSTYTSSVTMSTQSVVATTALQDNAAYVYFPHALSPSLNNYGSVHKTNNKGAIIGGVIGGIAMLVIFFTIVFCCRRRGRGKRQAEFSAWNGGDAETAKLHSCCNLGIHGHGHGGAKPQMSQAQQGDSLKISKSPIASISGPRRGKRPPPLQLQSLVTQVIASPSKKDPLDDPDFYPVLPTPDFGKKDPFRDSRNPGFSIVDRRLSVIPYGNVRSI